MRARISLHLLITVLRLSIPLALWADTEIVSQGRVAPGRAFAVYLISSDKLANVTTSVVHADGSFGTITAALEFDVAGSAPGAIYAALLAIPTISKEESVGVRFLFTTSRGTGVVEHTLLVDDASFRSEIIRLDTEMTNLLRGDEAKISAEAEELWAILLSSSARVLYHTGTLAYPIDSIHRTSFFGDRRTYRYSDDKLSYSIHNGVDYRGRTGTRVRAAATGRVVLAKHRIITGNSIVLEHLPGVFSLYYHLDAIDVSAGEIVTQGDEIGAVGATGLVTGPHLHWEMRVGGVATDPEWHIGTPLLDKLDPMLHVAR